jgi:lipopolysaccharide export system protein LptC
MNAIEIKSNFHNLIDRINNDQLLVKLYHIMEQASSVADGQLWSRLTEDEQVELLKIEQEVQSDSDLIPNEKMQTKHQKWL